MWHGLKRCLRSWYRLLRSSWQRNTVVSSSLHKLIGIGEVKLLSAAAGRVPWAFRWLFIRGPRGPRTNLLKLACHDQVAPAVHGEHQASDQVATVLMLLRVNHSDSCCRPMTVAGPCQCAAHSRFAFRCLSSSAEKLASNDIDNARSYRSEVIDLCAADIIAMRSENALSLVTPSCRESLLVWSSSVYGSRSPRPRTHCAGEYPLSSMAELPAHVTAAVGQVTRCIYSGPNLTLNSSSSRRACVFRIFHAAHRLRFAVE